MFDVSTRELVQLALHDPPCHFMFCDMPPCQDTVPVCWLSPVPPCVWLFTAVVWLRLNTADVMLGRYAASRAAREKSESRGVIRATAMSMLRSRARATASSSARSTRGPDVRKGWAGCSAPTAAGAAGEAAGVCAATGEN